MRFQLEHDWQDNMATPRSRLGERAKIHSFVVLCLIWVFAGLFGHAPWKGYETQSISAIHDRTDHVVDKTSTSIFFLVPLRAYLP